MAWLSAATHAALIRDPGCITHVWASTAGEFRGLLPPLLRSKPADLQCAAFASFVAYDLKPYGGSTALELHDLLDSPTLDCDNFCLLAWHLFTLLRPQTRCAVAMVGWDGGAVGNHAQLLAEEAGSAWLLDPTVGMLAAGVTIDSLCRGTRCEWFAFMPENRLAAPRALYYSAVRDGRYKASDLLYYYSPPSRYVTAQTRPCMLPTPAGQRR